MLPGRRARPAGPTGATLPAGLLSIEPYRRFVAETLRAGGLSDDFRSLEKPLLVAATDLDAARRVVFGEAPWDDVPISTEVAASSAIPTFFEPMIVRGRHLVDGNVGQVAHLDLVVSRGVRRVLVVSPLAPVQNGAGPCIVPGEDSRGRILTGPERLGPANARGLGGLSTRRRIEARLRNVRPRGHLY